MILTSKIIQTINNNEIFYKNACTKDGEDFVFNMKKATEVAKAFLNYNDVKTSSLKNSIIFTNGNPYTTLIICLIADIANIKIVLNINKNLEYLNETIVQSITDNVILKNVTSLELADYIKKSSKGKIYVFDDREAYRNLVNNSFPAIYITLMSLDIYLNDKKYEDIALLIDNYCKTNYIDSHLYYKFTTSHIEKRAEMDNMPNGFLILTDKPDDFKDLKAKTKDKEIYVNFNPFDRFEVDMCKKFTIAY